MTTYEKPTLTEVEVEKIVEENQKLKPCYEAMKLIAPQLSINKDRKKLIIECDGVDEMDDIGDIYFNSKEECEAFERALESVKE